MQSQHGSMAPLRAQQMEQSPHASRGARRGSPSERVWARGTDTRAPLAESVLEKRPAMHERNGQTGHRNRTGEPAAAHRMWRPCVIAVAKIRAKRGAVRACRFAWLCDGFCLLRFVAPCAGPNRMCDGLSGCQSCFRCTMQRGVRGLRATMLTNHRRPVRPIERFRRTGPAARCAAG